MTHGADTDELLRAWGAAVRQAAPPVDIPQSGFTPGHRGRIAAMAAAAVVVLVVAGIVTWASSGSRKAVAPPAHPTTTTALIPAGLKQVVFRGLGITVPASWPLDNEMCGEPKSNTVVLAHSGEFACLAPHRTDVTSVNFSEFVTGLSHGMTGVRSSEITVDGQRATRIVGERRGQRAEIVVVGALWVSVEIDAPTQAAADALASTLRIVKHDGNGCASSDLTTAALTTGRPPVRAGAGAALIPGAPTAVRICRYVATRIEQSAVLGAATRSSFVALLNSLPPGLSRGTTVTPAECRKSSDPPGSVTYVNRSDSEAFAVHASYATGPEVVVVIRLGECGDLGASNGTRTSQWTTNLIDKLASIVGVTVPVLTAVTPVR